jgi:hypothetical protein
LRFGPQIIAGNGQKVSKTLLVHVLGTFCMNINKQKIFLTKNKNDTI